MLANPRIANDLIAATPSSPEWSLAILGEKHHRHLVKEFIAHSHEERPHQGRGNVPLSVPDPDHPPTLPFPSGKVVCRERLGGLLKHYSRSAA